MTMRGSCLCGEVEVAISAPVDLAEFCHCKTCRRASGAPVMAWAGVERDAVAITGGTLRRFESSPAVERTFCGRCGTTLTIWDRDDAAQMFVAIAILEEAEACAPEVHIWRSQRLSWVDVTDELPRFLKFKRDGIVE